MDKLKKMRNKNKITCQQMAEQLNISKTYYWQLENKKRRLSYDMATKIAKILNTTPDELFFKEFKNKD